MIIPKYNIKQIQSDFNKGIPQEFYFFWGHTPSSNGSITRSCLRQWWKSEITELDTIKYNCAEQYMMSHKAKLFEDQEIYEQILKSSDPRQIKALGREVKNFNPDTWNDIKYQIVLMGNYLKFSQNPELKQFLLSTGNKILAEASPYDAVWGIKLSQDSPDINNPLKWRGENLLGFALMEVRDLLKKEEK